MLIGRVGNIESKVLSNGTKLTKMSIAHHDVYKDKSGQKQEKTTWISVKAFQKLAEIIETYGKVGQEVLVEGKLQVNKFKDANGKETSLMEILISEFKILGGRGENSAKQSSQTPAAHGNLKEPSGILDDDIPW